MVEDRTPDPTRNMSELESQEDSARLARDGASDVPDSTRQAATTFEQLLRNTIEQQPYTAIAIALGIGWLLGRSHRPL